MALTKPQDHSIAVTRTSRAWRYFPFLGSFQSHHPAPSLKGRNKKSEILLRPQLSAIFSPFSKAHKSSQSQDSTLATRQLPHEVAHHTLIALPSRSRQFQVAGSRCYALDAHLDKMWTTNLLSLDPSASPVRNLTSVSCRLPMPDSIGH